MLVARSCSRTDGRPISRVATPIGRNPRNPLEETLKIVVKETLCPLFLSRVRARVLFDTAEINLADLAGKRILRTRSVF